MVNEFLVYTDGACAGNPGQMGIGYVIYQNPGQKLVSTCSFSPGVGTNNRAEYLAVINALDYLTAFEPQHILVMSDSQLVVYQLTGAYAVKSPEMAKLANRVFELVNRLGCPVEFRWIPRSENKFADALASKAAGMPAARVSNNYTEIEEWMGDVYFTPNLRKIESLPPVNPSCAIEIDRLIHLGKKAKFKDYIRLKTDGTDEYSKADYEMLKKYITIRHGPKAVYWLIDVLVDASPSYAANALRWAARGLPPDMALKKASVDMEMAANLNNKKKEGLSWQSATTLF